MSEQKSSRKRFDHFVALGVCLWAATACAVPHAITPIPKPHFSIDAVSPTVGTVTGSGTITQAAVLDAPGPVVTFPGAGLRLLNPADELDEVSGNRSDVGPSDKFVILFAVDRATVGAAPPDPSLLPSRPYNVKDQAARHQAAGDTYMTLDGYNRSGGPLSLLRVPPKQNNTLVINQGDSGGIDDDLDPDVSPLMMLPPATPIDAIDGMYYDPPATSSLAMTQQQQIYFTLSRNSPSLFQLPGTPSGANVYVDPNPLTPFNETLYASAAQLGLVPGNAGDDIDGLIVFDFGTIGQLNVGVDQILFSLTRNSPSLGALFSPADIFFSIGDGTFHLFARAQDLGLLPNDNVTALELIKTEDPATTVYNSAIFLVIPGDFDNDGILTNADCSNFAPCYTGSGGSTTLACEIYDQDADGDVDCTDWKNFILIYRQLNGGASCPLLSVDEFVLALLGTPLQPAHICMADINLDGKTNGADIRPYIGTYLLGP